MQSDTRLRAEGANAPPLLDTGRFIGGCSCRYSAGAAVSDISTFGRIDYDLNADIKGFDHHFVVCKPEQRLRGIDAERLIAT